MVKGSLVFDADSLAGSAVGAGARSERDEPKLCPDPDRDVPHGASERAIAYQEQISALNNPQRPLPAGVAVSLENPLTGKNVAFDDCRESGRDDDRSQGDWLCRDVARPVFGRAMYIPGRWLKQARSQVDAAGSRDVEWFFAEPEAARKAKELFHGQEKCTTYQNLRHTRRGAVMRNPAWTEIKASDRKRYYVRASWEGRTETPDELAPRFLRMMDAFAANRSRFRPLDLRREATKEL